MDNNEIKVRFTKFEYDEAGYHVLEIKAYKADLQFFFNGLECYAVSINRDQEFMAHEDACDGAQFTITDVVRRYTKSLSQFISAANEQIESYVLEAEQEIAYERAMEQELSSPSATGRI